MTLLPTNPVAGLQIRPPGDDWRAVEQEPRSFVVNSGDTLRRWSNDRFLSTEHRVVNASGVDRYGIPFFFDPRVDTVVEPLAGCVDEANPPRHEPLVYRDYLTEFMGRGYPAVRS
jgi:isopenicillin N synthase-like dioxygenase